MAKIVLTNAAITLGASDVSSYVEQVGITYESEVQDTTTMGASGTRTKLPGLKNWSVALTFKQDFAAGAIDSIMFPLVGTSVAIAIQAVAGTITTSNPSYQGTVVVTSYAPLGTSVGAVVTAPVSLEGSGTLLRATS